MMTAASFFLAAQDGFDPALGGLDVEAEFGHLQEAEAAVHRVVVHNEDAPAGKTLGVDLAPGEEIRRLEGAAFADHDGDGEFAAMAGNAFDGDVAAHEAGEALGDRQAEAGAAVFAGGGEVGLVKGLEDALKGLAWDAQAGVGDDEAEGPAAVAVGVAEASSQTRPRVVNLTALPSRLVRIWPRRVRSVSMASGTPEAMSQPELRRFSLARGRRRMVISWRKFRGRRRNFSARSGRFRLWRGQGCH